ncbi:tryptophan 7-halogenase [Erythrobacter sp. EC-HK427]|uniref:tryptophan 7-halogenase n=1 Tax=Erythrobacter sp. EC-HK427 TaxID=2038396 RepID=UPI00125B5EAE|nr:tryptophan 7-halogenase [Erythrobacter sp. EC-HK427]VVT01142.1 conserved hypothetical protein [Erythrobacter sp. EC-HK427]
MSAPRELLRSVVVAGGGLTGVLAALALRRALPATQITVISMPQNAAAFADRAANALPYAHRFLERLGLPEDRIVLQAGGSHRLMTRYFGWSGEGSAAAFPYGAITDPALLTGFVRDWGGGRRGANVQTPPGSVAEMLADAGRYQPGLPGVEHALRWHPASLRDLAIGMAASLGVQHIQGRIGAVRLDAQGIAAGFLVEGAGEIAADLFVDCTGPAASLLAQMPGAERIDWSASLPVREVFFGKPGQPVLALEDRVSLTPAGWLHQMPGRDGLQRTLGVARTANEQSVVAALGGEPVDRAAFVPGRASAAWLGNVVALGDAAAVFEPLMGLNADFALRQIDLLLELLPGHDIVRDIFPGERDEYNRRTALLAGNVRDLLGAHYCSAAAQSLFGPIAVSDTLELAVDQFTRRGRTPFFEESPLLEQERASLFSALGLPRGRGSLPAVDDTDSAREFAGRMRAVLQAAPPYPQWMAGVLQHAREAQS